MILFYVIAFLCLPIDVFGSHYIEALSKEWDEFFAQPKSQISTPTPLSRGALEKDLKRVKGWFANYLIWQRPEHDQNNCYEKTYESIVSVNLNKDGRDAKAIYKFMALNHEGEICSIICKFYKSRSKCIEDSENLQKLNSILGRNIFGDEREQDSDVFKYPKIVCMLHTFVERSPHFIQHSSYAMRASFEEQYPSIILSKKVEEITLFDWLERFYKELPSEKDEETCMHLRSAGRQIGNFHVKNAVYFYDVIESKLHNDLHMKNVLYDFFTKRVAFVDNDTMGKFWHEEEDCSYDLVRLFFWHPDYFRRKEVHDYKDNLHQIKGVLPYFYLFKRAPFFSIPALTMHIYNIYMALHRQELDYRFHRIHVFLSPIKEGYLSAFIDQHAKDCLSQVIDACLEVKCIEK